jgi:hypothetical protein
MPLPVVAGIVIAAAIGAAAGAGAGSLFGGAIDDERKRIENSVDEYKKAFSSNTSKFETFKSYSDVINAASLSQNQGFGIDDTYLTDLSQAFSAPKEFDFRPEKK